MLSRPSLYCFGPHIVTEALLNDLPVVGYNLGVVRQFINNVNMISSKIM